MNRLTIGLALKTPEERKAIAQKGVATRKANRERLGHEHADAVRFGDCLHQQLAALEARLATLTRHEKIGGAALGLTNRALLTAEQIVAGAMPWEANSGVYFLVQDIEIVYVGQSRNVGARVSDHKDKTFNRYAFVPCSLAMLDQVESLYIHLLRPKLNGNKNDREKAAPLRLDQLFGKEIGGTV